MHKPRVAPAPHRASAVGAALIVTGLLGAIAALVLLDFSFLGAKPAPAADLRVHDLDLATATCDAMQAALRAKGWEPAPRSDFTPDPWSHRYRGAYADGTPVEVVVQCVRADARVAALFYQVRAAVADTPSESDGAQGAALFAAVTERYGPPDAIEAGIWPGEQIARWDRGGEPQLRVYAGWRVLERLTWMRYVNLPALQALNREQKTYVEDADAVRPRTRI